MWIENNLIQTQEDIRCYFYSLGLDHFDVENLFQIIRDNDDIIDWRQEAKEWELDSMQQFDKRNGLITDLQEVINDLRAGKEVKAKIADHIEQLCDYWY